MLAKRLHDIGFVVFAGCLAPDREGALKLKKSTSSRLQVLELNVTDDFHVQRAQTYVSDNLNGGGWTQLVFVRVLFCVPA